MLGTTGLHWRTLGVLAITVETSMLSTTSAHYAYPFPQSFASAMYTHCRIVWCDSTLFGEIANRPFVNVHHSKGLTIFWLQLP